MILPLLVAAALAPTSIGESVFESHVDKAAGSCATDEGHDFFTIYGGDGTYTNYDLAGGPSDSGTYTYSQLGPSEGKISYQVVQGDVWSGGDIIELLHFDTETQGSIKGEQGQADCRYEGTFTIKE